VGLLTALFGVLALGGNLFVTDDSRMPEWQALVEELFGR
jgi:hypothetical protein